MAVRNKVTKLSKRNGHCPNYVFLVFPILKINQFLNHLLWFRLLLLLNVIFVVILCHRYKGKAAQDQKGGQASQQLKAGLQLENETV